VLFAWPHRYGTLTGDVSMCVGTCNYLVLQGDIPGTSVRTSTEQVPIDRR
jgi:hypothetical protein